jgi:predicted regulator of Ras-like GTPase activity (Roadblock/LC7/MglB family)
MTLNDICNSLVKEVNEALGFAVVDISSGLMLAVAHNVPYFTQSYLDAVAAAAVDMFRGKTITNVEKLLSAQRGRETKNLVQEIQMTTEGTYHFMAIVPGKPQCLVVLITSRKANLGMGWAALRNALPDIAPLCP